MRYGFTTGSCAAAAAKAAAYMLLTGKKKEQITIDTPKGIPYTAEILDIKIQEKRASCAVRKDGGDDPDVTTGALIYAAVSYGENSAVISCVEGLETLGSEDDLSMMREKNLTVEEKKSNTDKAEDMYFSNAEKDEKGIKDIKNAKDVKGIEYIKDTRDVKGTKNIKDATDKELQERTPQIHIDGGVGVGRVTKPGLDQPVGNAAINHVPREMITKEVLEVCRIADYSGSLDIEISVPDGEKIAEKTFNPRLGIVGGISILGTTGIVEPMSSQALLDTIRVELKQRKAQGYDYVAVSPGNYGLDFMKKAYGYDLDKSVKCSNFIGNTIDMAVELGFRKMLLTGHIGKLIKVAGGIMNTHSKEGDCRMELLAAFAVRLEVEPDLIRKMLECVTTEEAVRILEESGKKQAVMDYAMERIHYYLNKRADGKMQVECIMYSNEFGELAKSREAADWFILLGQEQERQI